MIQINHNLLQNTILQAKDSNRKRKNFNFHETLDAKVQRMLNAIEPDSYVQPHKHEDPDKVEVFIILTGKILVIQFDDLGNITEHIVLSNHTGNFGVEIPSKTWHSIISLESGTVVYEVKDGPYSPIDDKNFALWAPKEGDAGCDDYNLGLLKKCGLIKI
jgi:cupin fold WbuC family metalloprotein